MRLIEEILSDSNIDRAILQVKRNKGVSGVDKMTVDELLNRKLYPSDDCKLYYPI